ncbi:thioredoxin domain-containing protein 3 homolog [Aplysia californica]|uniref:Thioredoxin domain-containing protein 3 homolog n=1 Tax=Aplysia californica TaxID=6500 RepID=A0ABM0K583_APLCA|nr:thioredoxin domain-containing protein 3 homolog [Aplysia californica]
MAKKKQEIQLQRELETQEEWEECLAMEGLWVVDVYQEWCGPCNALQGTFRRLKNELGDSLLHFAVAKADTIDALEQYRGRCEPTFLFYAGGVLVSFVHGANAPKVQRTLTEQLAHEHKVMEGQGERKEVKDTVMTRSQEIELQRQEEEEARREAEDPSGVSSPKRRSAQPSGVAQEEPKGVTVAIIKPDAVAQGKTDEIIKELQDNGIEIVAQEERELTDEEARELYSELSDEDYFEELIKFITSGPSHVLVLTKGETGEAIVKDWRDMLGPTNVEQAKEEAPDSLRAKYGEQGYMNALHGSSSSETAAKEMAFFFPNLAVPTYLKKKENIQRTLALIRPEAFSASKDEILEKIQEAGFTIALHKEIQLSKEQAQEFYKEHDGQAYFDQLVQTMSSGPLLALGLARDEAIDAWREMLGPPDIDEAQEQAPESLRAKFIGQSGVNQFHGSDSETQAKKELDFFFPMQETVAVIKPSGMGTKDAIIEKIHEAGFRIAAHKETTITKDVVDIMYANQQDKDYYDDLVNSMTSGETMFMVLSREDAVDGWRRMIGETNPEEAKTKEPDSLRAQFGQDILNNAVHGSSDPDRARVEMKAVFGDLQFNEDGTVKGEEPQLDEATVVIVKEGGVPVADVAPEYRRDTNATTGETTMDETTADQDTTQDITADTTQDVTAADATEADETQANETTQGDTTQMDTTQVETTEGETGEGDTTAGDTTVADTTMADTTAGDTTVADTTVADTTVADTTVAEGDTTTADATATDDTAGADASGEPTSAEPASTEQTQGSESAQPAASQEADTPAKPASPAAKEEDKQAEAAPVAGQTEQKEEKAEEPKTEAPKADDSAQQSEATPAAGDSSASSGEVAGKKDETAGETTADQTTEGTAAADQTTAGETTAS